MEQDDIEFWRLAKVIEKVGLSRREIYRRIQRSEFPKSRAYPGGRIKFWVSTDIRNWQREVINNT